MNFYVWAFGAVIVFLYRTKDWEQSDSEHKKSPSIHESLFLMEKVSRATAKAA